MKNNSFNIKVTSNINQEEKPLIFPSLLQCATYFKLSCPSIKKKLKGEIVKALVNYTITECDKEVKKDKEDKAKKIYYWTCDKCNEEMRLTSKKCHLISHKHLSK